MENEEEQFAKFIEEHDNDTIIHDIEVELEMMKKEYLKLKAQLIEWQAACIRADLGIKYIQFKRKTEKEIWHEFFKKGD